MEMKEKKREIVLLKKKHRAEKKERKRMDGLYDVLMEDKKRSDALLDSFHRREGECTKWNCASLRVRVKQLEKDVEALTKWSPVSAMRLTM